MPAGTAPALSTAVVSARPGGLTGGALALHRLLRALSAPAAVSQTFDATSYLNAVRWVLDRGDASSLHLG